MLRFAGQKWFPLWGQIKHRGRKSGKEYAIPVAVIVTPDRFIVGLPWGARTNWVQNVLAADGCTVLWKGRDYRATDPKLVDKQAALAAATGVRRALLTRFNLNEFLQLQR